MTCHIKCLKSPPAERDTTIYPPLSIAGVNSVTYPSVAAAVTIAVTHKHTDIQPFASDPLRAPLCSALANNAKRSTLRGSASLRPLGNG